MKNKNTNTLTILYILVAILSIVLAFINYTEGKFIISALWIINSILNLTIGYEIQD